MIECCDDLLAHVKVQDKRNKKIEEQAAVSGAMRGQEDNVTRISKKVDATSQPAGVREIVDKTGSKKGGQGNPEEDFAFDQCSYMGTRVSRTMSVKNIDILKVQNAMILNPLKTGVLSAALLLTQL